MKKIFFSFFLIFLNYCFSAQYKNKSILSDGKWIKIKIEKTGIHKIPFTKLKELGFSNIENIRIYGYGGTNLPETVGQSYDDLPETPIKIFDNSIFFFGKGTTQLFYNNKITYSQNLYSKYSYYFITELANGRKIEKNDFSNLVQNIDVNSYDYFSFHEEEKISLLMRGKIWLGEFFNEEKSSYSFSFEVKNRMNNFPVKIFFSLVGKMKSEYLENNNYTKFKYNINDSIGYIQMPQIYGNNILTKSETINYNPKNTDNLKIDLSYSFPNIVGYLDFISIQTKCNLQYNGEQLLFRNIDTWKKTTKYNLTSSYSDLNIWNVSKQDSVKEMTTNLLDKSFSFKYYSNSIEEFIAFRYSDAYDVLSYESVINQNIHNDYFCDYLIITPNEFYEQAERLADFHRKKDSLKVFVATSEQIYNEFSSGRKDIMAIKNFVKMFYDRANLNNKKLKYLLLFSDVTYDPKGNLNIGNLDKLIPSYNSANLDKYNTFMCDDFYGFLDNTGDESILSVKSTIDIGIGRVPINTLEQAKNYVDKIYNFSINNGIWKNNICLLADDADDIPDYMLNSEECSKILNQYPQFNQKKIYQDSYKESSTSSEDRYPEASSELIKSINNGALITSYMGHGSAARLSHETLIDFYTISSLNNKNQGLWITGTCDFAPIFDNNTNSAGEEFLLNKNGGAVAILSTTITSFQNINSAICKSFFSEWSNNFETPIGEIIRRCKNQYKESIKTFILLGDPALKLTTKSNLVIPTQINNNPIKTSGNDTLIALKDISLKGSILKNPNLFIDTTFNGTLYFLVYDKPDSTITLGNDGYKMPFSTQRNIISKGQTQIVNGRFEIKFIIPKDISIKNGLCKINFYASKSDSSNGYNGYYKFISKSNDSINCKDFEGPIIKLYLDDTTFTNGQNTGISPVVKIFLNDDSGINTSTSGIGHELLLISDNKNEYVVNDYYQAKSIISGYLEYQIFNLEEGQHSLKFKAFDIYNNSTIKTVYFNVKNNLDIIEVFNYPNPVIQENYLKFKHNKINSTYNIKIEVYNLLGTKIAYKDFNNIVISNNYYTLDISELSTTLTTGIYMLRINFITLEDLQSTEKIIKIFKK